MSLASNIGAVCVLCLSSLASSSCVPATRAKGPPLDTAVVFAPRGGGEGVDGRVRCEAAGPETLGCSISQDGDRPLTVCFHAEFDCANGSHANAESCRDVAPGTEVRTLHSAEGCDQAVSGRVTAAWAVEPKP